ncbi:MAG: hypothetical protein ABEJ76_01570 [Halanaeroarchaeum sp.]
MDDLTGASDRTTWRRPLRLAFALALLLAGVMVLAAGVAIVGSDALTAVGVSPGVAPDVALAVAAVLPPVILYGVLRSVEAPASYRRYALAGTGTAASGVVLGLVARGLLLDRAAAFLYALGVLLTLVALAGSFVADGPRPDRSRPSYRREGARGGSGVTPADGGEEDDDLVFHLDDEE